MVWANVELDLSLGVELSGYHRSVNGQGFEVKFPLPDICRCEKCDHEEAATCNASVASKADATRSNSRRMSQSTKSSSGRQPSFEKATV